MKLFLFIQGFSGPTTIQIGKTLKKKKRVIISETVRNAAKYEFIKKDY